ncbi:MAG: RES family NAD+ phosphorylase [Terracidiphilus sp.]
MRREAEGRLARLKDFDQRDMHRLIPTSYPAESVIETLSLPANVIRDLTELDAATNERKIAGRGGNVAITPGELLCGVPEAHIVNAAFTHAGPWGGRFNDPRRGAWYAGVELETSIDEVAFHKRRFLRDSRIRDRIAFDYADFLADFSGQFHFLDDSERQQCLQAEPIPQCYGPSQTLANALLYSGSSGVVYSSVRHQAGTCIASFRPALVFHPRRGKRLRIAVAASNNKVESSEIAF